MDEQPPSSTNGDCARTRMWRALLRVVAVTPNGFRLVIPGWNPHCKVDVSREDVPAEVRPKLSPGYRLYAKVNLGAENKADLRFSDWELAPPRSPEHKKTHSKLAEDFRDWKRNRIKPRSR